MAKPSHVLLTVPHAVSLSSETRGHPRDFAAPELAQQIANICITLGTDCALRESSTPRSIVDGNRPWSRQTPWRQELTKMVFAGHITAHADIHSFPVHYPGFPNMDVVLLTGRRPTVRYTHLAEKLFTQAKVRVGLVVSPGMVDISNQLGGNSTACPIPSYMVELNEDLSGPLCLEVAKIIARELVGAKPDTDLDVPCRVVHREIVCLYVNHQKPLHYVPLWIPSTELFEPEKRICGVCRRSGASHLCEACASVAYCSREHQMLDWNSRDHASICPLITMPPATACCAVGQSIHKNTCCFCGSCISSGDSVHVGDCYRKNVGRPTTK